MENKKRINDESSRVVESNKRVRIEDEEKKKEEKEKGESDLNDGKSKGDEKDKVPEKEKIMEKSEAVKDESKNEENKAEMEEKTPKIDTPSTKITILIAYEYFYEEEIVNIEDFTKKYNFDITLKYNEEAKKLIIPKIFTEAPTSKDYQILNSNLILGIINGIQVISFDWIEDCLKKDEYLDPSDYILIPEITKLAQSRISGDLPKIFDLYTLENDNKKLFFYFHSNCFWKTEKKPLLQACGDCGGKGKQFFILFFILFFIFLFLFLFFFIFIFSY